MPTTCAPSTWRFWRPSDSATSPSTLSTQGGDIPSGATVGCNLSYPLSFGNLYAGVSGYTNGDLTGDPGPLAKKVCKRLLHLGWR